MQPMNYLILRSARRARLEGGRRFMQLLAVVALLLLSPAIAQAGCSEVVAGARLWRAAAEESAVAISFLSRGPARAIRCGI